jgi:RNA polymerase sigma-70 factor (ECF subfamily)
MELRAAEAEDIMLIGDFQARRESALAAAYRLHWRTLFSAALGVLHERQDAEDCVHDVLVDVWSRKVTYRPQRGTLRAFLVTCVRNAAITRKRSTSRHREIETALFTQQCTVDSTDFADAFHLRATLSTLPPEQLRALRLAFFAQRTHAEIARELDVPLGTVKSRLALAIKKLNVRLR